jgi:hypothetical protein
MDTISGVFIFVLAQTGVGNLTCDLRMTKGRSRLEIRPIEMI